MDGVNETLDAAARSFEASASLRPSDPRAVYFLGVVAAIECVQALHDAGRRLPFAVEVVGFADEEGVRYVVKAGIDPNGIPEMFEILQKEVFAPNLPMYVNGTAAFIGDYIDRGPHAREVVDYLLSLPFRSVFLMGNHEQMLLDFLAGQNEELFLLNGHITPLKTASTHITPDPMRTRKLLLHRREIDRLVGAVERKGYTVVPLELYFKKGKAKVALALGKLGSRDNTPREDPGDDLREPEDQSGYQHDPNAEKNEPIGNFFLEGIFSGEGFFFAQEQQVGDVEHRLHEQPQPRGPASEQPCQRLAQHRRLARLR